jgi:putative aldouronate transport system permease protein
MKNKEVKIKKKAHSSGFITELSQNRYLYLLAIPILLYYALFCYLPMCGIVIAFKNYNIGQGIFESQWVGLKYFKEFFSSVYFVRLLKNTFTISIYDLVVGFPAPIIFALLLNEIKNQLFKKTVQTATYLPHFISMVVICGMITNFFGTNGIGTKLLMLFGLPNMNYVGNKDSFRSIYVFSNVWQSIGWNSIIYLAALTGIDQQLYEAASIDGAGRFRRLLHVTLPGILQTIVVMLILRLGQILSVGYEKIILLYSPGTYETADVISSYVYRVGLQGSRYSYSTAVGVFQSLINITILFLANLTCKKTMHTSLF